MKNKWIVYILLISMCLPVQLFAADKPLEAEIIKVTGSSLLVVTKKYKMYKAEAVKAAIAKDGAFKVPEGSRIRTRLATSLQLKLPDDRDVHLGPNTSFNMSSIGEKTDLFLEPAKPNLTASGKFSVNKKLVGTEKSFTVRTPTAVAGVRGTQFGFVLSNGVSNLSVLEGIVEIATPGAPEQKIEVKLKSKVSVSKAAVPKAATPMTKAEVSREQKAFAQIATNKEQNAGIRLNPNQGVPKANGTPGAPAQKGGGKAGAPGQIKKQATPGAQAPAASGSNDSAATTPETAPTVPVVEEVAVEEIETPVVEIEPIDTSAIEATIQNVESTVQNTEDSVQAIEAEIEAQERIQPVAPPTNQD